MKKNLIKLLVSLSLVSNLSYADTTGNLVSQDFTTGWTNTGNTYHGSSTIAGHHNGTVESDSVSLNAEDINKESLNEGFTVTGSAEYWFWSGYNASVTQTIKTVDDNGNTLTQTRVVTGTSGSYNTLSDQLIVSSNTQQDYNVSLKYDFTDNSGLTGHYSADLKNPSLSVTYTYVPPLDSATQTALLDLNNDIKDDLKDVDTFKFEEDDFKFEETFTEMPEFETYEMTEEIKEEDKQEVLDTNSFTETAEPSDEKTDAPLSQAEDSQDPQELQNLVKIKLMSDNNALESYANIQFYKPKNIYLDQIDIRDNRVLYADASLVSYQQKDPLFQAQKELFDIRQEKQKLIREIQILKNVR